MKKIILSTFTLLFLLNSMPVMSASHINMKVTRRGLYQILTAALQFNNMGKIDSPSAVIEDMVLKQIIPAEELSQNKVVKIIEDISSISFKNAYDFYVISNDVKVSGKVNQNDIVFNITNYTKKGFNIDLSVNVDKLKITAKKIKLCELANEQTGACSEDMLQGSFNNILVRELSSKKINVTASLKATINEGSVNFKIEKTSTNLNETFAQDLDIDFDLNIPPLKIRVNGVEAEMPMGHLKDQILAEKDFLASKLLSFAAQYFTNDLVEMLNKYFKKVKLPTGYNDDIVTTNYYNPVNKYNNDYNTNYYNNYNNVESADALYVAPTYNVYENYVISNVNTNLVGDDALVTEIVKLIGSASFEVELSRLFTSTIDKSINAALKGDLIVNGRSLSYPGKIRQRRFDADYSWDGSGYSVYKLDLQNVKFKSPLNRSYGMALSISDPVFNSILLSAERENLFTRAFRAQAGEMASGIYVTDVHVHMQPRRKAEGNSWYRPKIYVVAEVKVDVANVYTEKWYEWLGKKVGGLLEGNVYFPLQFALTPSIETVKGKKKLKITIDDPLTSNNDPKNYFNYYSDFDEDNIYGVVRTQFRNQLNIAMKNATKPIYLDLDDLMGKSGVNMEPVDVDVEKTGHLVLYLDLKSIDINKLQGK